MATGAIGGRPTTSMNTFAWSGSFTGTVYTVPANTLSYVTLAVWVGATASTLVINLNVGSLLSAISIFSGSSGGSTINNLDSASGTSMNAIPSRISYAITTTGVNATFMMFPGETLSIQSVSTGSANLQYGLLEVASS